DELRVVVSETEQSTRDGSAEYADRLPAPMREQQKRNRDRGENDDPAHRRRTRLGLVPFGALLTDVLTEFAVAQEIDEPRAEEQAHQQRGRSRDQHRTGCGPHQTARASANNAPQTSFSPTPSEPFTSTTSPCWRSSATIAAASAASATGCDSPSKASAIAAASGPTVISRSTPASVANSPNSA